MKDKSKILIVGSPVGNAIKELIVAELMKEGGGIIVVDESPKASEVEQIDIQALLMPAYKPEVSEPSRPLRSSANDRKRQREDFRRQSKKFK